MISFKELNPKQVRRYFRRWFLIIFRPYYVMSSLSQRRGFCSDCGCCNTWCKYFSDDNHCSRWKNLPFTCKLFPIDERDKEKVRDMCTFFWVRK